MAVEGNLRRTGDWDKIRRFTDDKTFKSTFERHMERGLESATDVVHKNIREAILTRGRSIQRPFAPLREQTIANKRFTPELRDQGTLLSSIVFERMRKLRWRAGIDLKAKYPNGSLVGVVALAQQAGGTFRMTPELRAVLRAKGFTPRSSTQVVIVPPRPFVGPAVVKSIPEVNRIIFEAGKDAFNELLRG